MKKKLIIKADTNDADYVTSIHTVSDKELDIIMPIIKAIEKFDGSYNWNTSEYCDEKDPYNYYVEELGIDEESYDYFSDYCPYGENGIHTIESIKVYEVVKEINLLK